MSDENSTSLFPNMRIKAYDGMPVTAEVWEKAHSYHLQQQQAHNLYFHGTGILTGLEVVASDPADNIIFVLPGVAVDERGQLIVLNEPVAYDLGNEVDGQLYLLISHRESLVGDEKAKKNNETLFSRDEFLLIARSEIPDGLWIELARFKRENKTRPISEPSDPNHPAVNEIDQRYRKHLKITTEQQITASVVYLGKPYQQTYDNGLLALSKELANLKKIRLIIDNKSQVTPEVLNYQMVFLVAEGEVKFSNAQVNGLQGYIERGGMIFMDACDEKAAESFKELLKQMDINVLAPLKGHTLLSEPYLFATPPAGYTPDGSLRIGKGVIFSTYNYGGLWNGETKGGAPNRADIRSATEFGINLLYHMMGSAQS